MGCAVFNPRSHRRFVKALAMFLVLLVLQVSAKHATANIIYDIVNYPAYQNGWTITGTITTDGNTGTITSSDLDAFSFSITNGTTTYSASSPSGSFSAAGTITATSTNLSVVDLAYLSISYSNTGITWYPATVGSFLYGEGDGTSLFDTSPGPPSAPPPANGSSAKRRQRSPSFLPWWAWARCCRFSQAWSFSGGVGPRLDDRQPHIVAAQPAPHPLPPAPPVLADADGIRTLLIRPGHTLGASLDSLYGQTNDPRRPRRSVPAARIGQLYADTPG